MAKKIPNMSQWGQGKARQRYQVGGASFVPPQAMTRPGMPMGPMRRPFQSGGKASSPVSQPKPEQVEPLKVDPEGPLGKALIRQKPVGSYPNIKFER